MAWKCPDCGSTNLKVEVTMWVVLTQDEANDNFETEIIEGDHEWDDKSWMMCRNCAAQGRTKDFEVPG